MTNPHNPENPVDPTLNRVPYFDERSRQYAIREVLSEVIEQEQRIWTPRAEPLNQGSEGACVGFGWAAELASTPVDYSVNNQYAFDLYAKAQEQDRAMGNHWESGASVLAGAKACTDAGLINEYRWAFGVADVIDTILDKGPVVIGINWYESMYQTDENHLVHIDGQLVGGHCILVNGYLPEFPVKVSDEQGYTEEVFVLTNSWGESWGNNGTGYITRSDLETLLEERGEACIATDTSHTAPGPVGYPNEGVLE